MAGLKQVFLLMTLLVIVVVLFISSSILQHYIVHSRLSTSASDTVSQSWSTQLISLQASLAQESTEDGYTDDNNADHLTPNRAKHVTGILTNANHGYADSDDGDDKANQMTSKRNTNDDKDDEDGDDDDDKANQLTSKRNTNDDKDDEDGDDDDDKANQLTSKRNSNRDDDDDDDDDDDADANLLKSERQETVTPNSYGMVQKRLIILTYMRSGSTMTGRLFDRHPDVFYWFEPLHSLARQSGKNLNKWARRRKFSISDEAIGNVSTFLNCDVKNMFGLSLKDRFMEFGRVTERFRNCFKNGSRKLWLTKSSDAWDRCVSKLTMVCLKDYPIVALKTIRLSLSGAVELMRKDPNLWVLHLVRDPRGTLESRRRINYANFSELQSEAYNLCKDISNDLNISQSIEEGIRKRYMLVRYEDVAKSPVHAVKLYYDFIGLAASEEGIKLAERMSKTAPGFRRPCPTCPAQKNNSTVTSQSWRQTVTLTDVGVISDQCSHLMTLMGYRVRFSTEEELQDLSASAVEQPRVKVASRVFQQLH